MHRRAIVYKYDSYVPLSTEKYRPQQKRDGTRHSPCCATSRARVTGVSLEC